MLVPIKDDDPKVVTCTNCLKPFVAWTVETVVALSSKLPTTGSDEVHYRSNEPADDPKPAE